MRLSIFMLGIIGMTAQAAFLREVLATFRAGELTIGVVLLFWLLWTSVGSGILGRFSTRFTDPGRWFHILFPWFGVLGYMGITLIGTVPFLARLTPGELVSYDLQCIAAACAFLPFNILGGFLFTLGIKALEFKDSPSAGRAFTLEAFGAASAGVIVSLLLVKIASNNMIALTCPLLAIFTVLHWCIRDISPGSLFRLVIPIALLAGIIWWNGQASHYSYKGQTLLSEKDTKYGRLRVTERGEQITFYSDASTLFSVPDPETSEYTAHIPMLAAERPQHVLVLGGGLGGVIDEVLKYNSVETVTCVELDPGLFELADRFLEEAWANDRRVETVFADSRAFLEHTQRSFDVVIMNMQPPLSGVTNRYYTREFFRLVESRLTERGVFGFSLPGAENYISKDLAYFLASIRSTLRSVFPSVTTLPGLQCRFLAGNTAGLVDSLGWEQLVERRKRRGIETSYVRDYFMRYTMSPERMAFLTENLDAVQSPTVNSDIKPNGYFSRTIVQGNLDASRITRFITPLAKKGNLFSLMVLSIVITIMFAAFPGKGAIRRTVMATVMSVGMTEISLEVLAIMAYQSIFGFLYGRIALLVGFYMGGLTLGALIGTRLIERKHTGTKHLAAVQTGMSLIPLVWALVLCLHSNFPGYIPALEAIFYILTALSGVAGGLQFPVADSLYRTSLPRGQAGPGAIYGIDLTGSSVGALVTASLMVPILGMIPVLVFLGVLNSVTAGVLWVRSV